MSLPLLGLATLLLALAGPWAFALWLARGNPREGDPFSCFGLDGRSSTACCGRAGFSGSDCPCPCHNHVVLTWVDRRPGHGHGQLQHHLHRGAAPWHPLVEPTRLH